MKKNKNNIFLIRNTINKNLLKKGYSMQASYFQTDSGYIDYIYTDLETKELVFLVIAENYTKDFSKGINPFVRVSSDPHERSNDLGTVSTMYPAKL